MNVPARVPTSLRHAPSAPLSKAELDRLRAQAWTERGMVCIAPDEIADPWLRQGLINLATKLFGKRMKRG